MYLLLSSFLAGFRRAGSGGECPYPSSCRVDRPEQSWACSSFLRDVSRLRSRLCARRTNLTSSDRPWQGRKQGSVRTPTRMLTYTHNGAQQPGLQACGVGWGGWGTGARLRSWPSAVALQEGAGAMVALAAPAPASFSFPTPPQPNNFLNCQGKSQSVRTPVYL